MWILFRRVALMMLTSWALSLAVKRWPRLAPVGRLVGGRRRWR